MSTVYRVHVLGPNLGASDATFHVHAAGCADVKRSAVYRFQDQRAKEGVEEFTSIAGALRDWFADFTQGDETDQEILEGYEAEFKWFPCVGRIPSTTEEAT